MKIIKEDITPLDVETLRADYVHLTEATQKEVLELGKIATQQTVAAQELLEIKGEIVLAQEDLQKVKEETTKKRNETQKEVDVLEVAKKSFEAEKTAFSSTKQAFLEDCSAHEKNVSEFHQRKNILASQEQNHLLAVAQLASEVANLAKREVALNEKEIALQAREVKLDMREMDIKSGEDSLVQKTQSNSVAATSLANERKQFEEERAKLAEEKLENEKFKNFLEESKKVIFDADKKLTNDYLALKTEKENQNARQRTLDIKEGELVQWEREIKARVINT